MRLLFLIPEIDNGVMRRVADTLRARSRVVAALLPRNKLKARQTFGGTLNIIRHCLVARRAGIDAALATLSGRDTYGTRWGPGETDPVPTVRWRDRGADDFVVLPDFASFLADDVRGPCAIYQQNPIHVRANFDTRRRDRHLWTDSPFMEQLCRAAFPGRDIVMVPNVVDAGAFPFVPQARRTAGELLAFPRKGPEFIEQTMAAYHATGGRYWRLTTVHGLPFRELAARFATPQAFLASAEIEGCALPPQESMAAGVLVVGRTANGANFCMVDGRTALVGETPQAAAAALHRAEDAAVRDRITRSAHEDIARFFPDREPLAYWRAFRHAHVARPRHPVPVGAARG